MTPQDLLNSHLGHWHDIRKEWKRASCKNEERFAASCKVLREMFENS